MPASDSSECQQGVESRLCPIYSAEHIIELALGSVISSSSKLPGAAGYITSTKAPIHGNVDAATYILSTHHGILNFLPEDHIYNVPSQMPPVNRWMAQSDTCETLGLLWLLGVGWR